MITLSDSEKILKCIHPGDLFSQYDENIIKNELKMLRIKWHPDTNKDPKANKVFIHIEEIYNKAKEQLKNGNWESIDSIIFKSIDNKLYKVKYYTSGDFELGSYYISDSVLVYVVNNLYRKYVDNFVKIVTNIMNMTEEAIIKSKIFLPEIISNFETIDGKLVLVIKKTKDQLMLRDVIDHFPDGLPEKQAAWIMSRHYEWIGGLLWSLNLSHNGITVENCFISPEHHTVSWLGGWWYATEINKPMIGTISKIKNIMSHKTLASKKGNIETDLDSIRLLGRELFKDHSGTTLHRKNIAVPFVQWINGVTTGKSLNDLKEWKACLIESYGPRKFIKWDITRETIYPNHQ